MAHETLNILSQIGKPVLLQADVAFIKIESHSSDKAYTKQYNKSNTMVVGIINR